MAVEYGWIISNLTIKKTQDSLTDIITLVDWRRFAKDGDIYTDIYGQTSLDSPNPNNFIDYSLITKQQVISWIEEKLSVSDLNYSLNLNLENIKNPPVYTTNPPWNED